MICPKCGAGSRVANSRKHQSTLRRRRVCLLCDHRWTTLEVISTTRDILQTLDLLMAKGARRLEAGDTPSVVVKDLRAALRILRNRTAL